MTQETPTKPQKAKVKRDRVKIKAKCPKCKKRMSRDDNNMAYCKEDGVQEIGPSRTPKGTASTMAKVNAKSKDRVSK